MQAAWPQIKHPENRIKKKNTHTKRLYTDMSQSERELAQLQWVVEETLAEKRSENAEIGVTYNR